MTYIQPTSSRSYSRNSCCRSSSSCSFCCFLLDLLSPQNVDFYYPHTYVSVSLHAAGLVIFSLRDLVIGRNYQTENESDLIRHSDKKVSGVLSPRCFDVVPCQFLYGGT